MFWKPKVLVVGSTLIDTLATRPVDDTNNLISSVRSGTIRHSFGGSAYNIAVNLGYHEPPANVGIYTFLMPKSHLTDLVKDRLQQLRVSTKFVREQENIKIGENQVTPNINGAFLGLRNTLNQQITATAVEETMGAVDFLQDINEQKAMRKAIAASCCAVVDTGSNIKALF
jgi:sugar/nucleoside kinase (ribokinase family)